MLNFSVKDIVASSEVLSRAKLEIVSKEHVGMEKYVSTFGFTRELLSDITFENLWKAIANRIGIDISMAALDGNLYEEGTKDHEEADTESPNEVLNDLIKVNEGWRKQGIPVVLRVLKVASDATVEFHDIIDPNSTFHVEVRIFTWWDFTSI